MNQTVSLEEHKKALAEIELLKFELAQLKKLIFGSKKERFKPVVDSGLQGDLFNSTVVADPTLDDQTEQVNTTTSTKKKRKTHPGRTPLPENIPVEELIIEPHEDTSDMTYLGDDISETIDYTPGILIKRRIIRRKYVRNTTEANQQTIVIAPKPSRPIDKGIAEAGLLSHLFVSKYVDHLPFYRQIEQFKRNFDWTIHKSTINDWFAATCSLMEPLYDCLIKSVLNTDYLQSDESPIKVLDKTKTKKTHQGYMWAYRNPINSLVLFDYRKGRGKNGPREILNNFEGHLQCDGYKVYDSIAKGKPTIELVSCMAHIRRKFYEAKDHHKAKAEYALRLIQKLYEMDRAAKKAQLTTDQRLQKRQSDSLPIFNELEQWVKQEQTQNLSKGPIGKALHYATHQLPKLRAYFHDGRIEIDNNRIENVIRPLALGRKNYLFAGSHKGAQRAAMMYSFFASYKTMNVNPWKWLKQTLEKLPDHPINHIEQLLPAQPPEEKSNL